MEYLTLTWIRPNGEKAITVEFPYATPEEVSDILADLLDVFGGMRSDVQAQRQAVKDTVRGMEGR